MTLILALRYASGTLLAADSQATSQASGQFTKQEVEKLFTWNGTIGWGASGAVGLTQRLKIKLDGDDKTPKVFANETEEKGAERLLTIVNPLQKEGVKEFVKDAAPPGSTMSVPQNIACLFVGAPHKKKPFILEIAANGVRQFHPVAYAAIGSGDVFALHAIRSVAHYEIQSLTRQQATALAYRTIDNAINTAAFGLGSPVQMVVVEDGAAKQLAKNELEAVRDMVDVWKQKELETLGSLSPISQGASDVAALAISLDTKL